MTMETKELKKIDAYFRAANYLSACQLYLLDNPLLRRKLTIKDINKLNGRKEFKNDVEVISTDNEGGRLVDDDKVTSTVTREMLSMQLLRKHTRK